MPASRCAFIVAVAATPILLLGSCIDSGRNLPPDYPVSSDERGRLLLIDDRCDSSLVTKFIYEKSDDGNGGPVEVPLYGAEPPKPKLLAGGRRLYLLPGVSRTRDGYVLQNGKRIIGGLSVVIERKSSDGSLAFFDGSVPSDGRVLWDNMGLSLREYLSRSKCVH